MRVLVLNYEYPPLGGGAANATYFLLRELSRLEIEADLITSSEGSETLLHPFPGIKVYKLDIGKNSELHNQSSRDLLTYSAKAYGKATALIEERGYDLVHAFFGIPCGFIAMFLGLPYIVSLRGSDVPFYSRKYYWLDKFVFRRLSRVIWRKSRATVANSIGLAALAKQTAPEQHISVIPNGVDTELFRPSGKSFSIESICVLYCGRLIERKGIRELVEAFAAFNSKRSHRLVVAGDGPLRAQLEQLVQESGQDECIQFLGVVEKAELPLIYQRADFFALPSRNEGMSNSVLEAMAAGLPVLVTNTGGSHELVDENGIVIESVSKEGILRGLQAMQNECSHFPSMSLRSRKRALENCWSAVAKQYLKVYESCGKRTLDGTLYSQSDLK